MSKLYKHSYLNLFSPKYILTWPLFFVVWLIGQIPHKANIKLGKTLGNILYLFFPKRKYIIRTNLRLCFPDKSDQEIEQLVKDNFISLAIGICETAIAWYGSEKQLDIIAKNTKINNEHVIKTALASDKPVLFVTPHASSTELLSKVLIRKYPYYPVFRHMNNPIANYLMQKARLRIYKNHILKADTRSIVKQLKQKVPIAILPDQDFGRKRSIFVPFYSVPAATTTSLSKYKKLTDCHVIALSYHRNPDNQGMHTFDINISTPMDITGHDLEHDARELNKEVEQIINKDIAMYFWIARRFKTRPLGESKIYNYKPKSA